MKSKLSGRVPTLATITALMLGIAAMAHADDQKNAANPPTAPATPVPPGPNQPPAIALPQWIDPDWKDPGGVMPEVGFDLPMTEVARRLRTMFKDAFDVILPGSCDLQNPNVPMPFLIDPGNVNIKLQLKNVTATEVLNAMNLMFEAQNTPLRWELKMNGNRPLALLRVVPALFPQPFVTPPPPPVEKKRMVFFVGDLVGNAKSGGMTMDHLFNTICSVYNMGYAEMDQRPPSQNDLKFHAEAQLIIVNASVDKINFVQNTLAALRQKAQMPERKAVDSKTESETPKKSEAAPEPNK